MSKKDNIDESVMDNDFDEEYQEHTEETYQYDRVKDFEGKGYHTDPIKRKHKLMHDELYIHERLITQRDWYDKKALENQHSYKSLKRWEFILAASIPVVISLSTMGLFKSTVLFWNTTIDSVGVAHRIEIFNLSDFFQVFAAISGIVLVVINKLLELEEYYKNWKDYRATNERLEQERLLYLTRTEPYDEENAFPMLVETVEELLAKQLQRWKHVAKNPKQDVIKNSKVKPPVNEEQTTEVIESNSVLNQSEKNDIDSFDYPDDEDSVG